MRGSITEIDGAGGSILAEDGCEFAFDRSAFDGFDCRKVAVGQWVEFEEQLSGTHAQAVKIRLCSQQASGSTRKITMPFP